MRRSTLFALLVPTLSAALFCPAFGIDLGDGQIHLKNETYDRERGPESPAEGREEMSPDAVETWLVAFQAPADAMIRSRIERFGRIVGYVPSSAYLVRTTGPRADLLRAESGVDRVDRFRAAWKIASPLGQPEPAGTPAPPPIELVLEIFAGENPRAVAETIAELGVEVLTVHDRAGARRVIVRTERARVSELARISEVEWIEKVARLTLRNDSARWVIQSNAEGVTPLHDRGLFGEGEIVGHIDGPIAHLSCFFRDPVDPTPGPDHRKLVAYRSEAGFGGDPHGTHTAGTVAGDSESMDGLTVHRGMAPLARLSHSNFFDLNGEWNGLPSNLNEFLEAAHDDGARIHSNSWGDDSRTFYTSWSRDVDLFTRRHEDAFVVFAVTNRSTLKSPENAKNSLAVAATQRAPSQDQMGSGGAGPTVDGRRKPEVTAPGIGTISAASFPCGAVSSSGTSMACPTVAGGAALVREYLVKGFHPSGVARPEDARIPTGALLKALTIHSAADMGDVPGYPGDREGWGRVLLDDVLFFPGDSRKLWLEDVWHEDGLLTGEVDTFTLRVANAAIPLKITLAFTDEPASLGAAFAAINNLDLEVSGPNGEFLGNVFDSGLGVSRAGGTADLVNNVERVILLDPTPGEWTVRVRAGAVPFGPQGYALVATGRFGRLTFHEGDGPEIHPTAGTPERFSLEPMRPNPFRGEAVIRYAVPEPAEVKIGVYDLTGRLVRVLTDRVVGAGQLQAIWDGRDGDGRASSPGVYLFRLEAPGFSRTVKGVLLR